MLKGPPFNENFEYKYNKINEMSIAMFFFKVQNDLIYHYSVIIYIQTTICFYTLCFGSP